MLTSELRQEIIDKLIQLDPKKEFSISNEMIDGNWKNLKAAIHHNLDKLKSSTKMYLILAYILLAITGIFSAIKVFDSSSWPDLNKGALIILFTVTNSIVAFRQKLSIERMEKQILLLDILVRIEEKKENDMAL